MQTPIVRNQPERRASLLFMIPGLLLSLFYVLTIHNGEMSGYLWSALVGVVGFGLGFVRILRPLRLWAQFTLGVAIGGGSLLVALIWSPMMNLGIRALHTESWQMVRLALELVVCLVLVILLARVLKRSRRLYWAVAGIFLGNGILAALMHIGGNEYFVWNLNWTLGFSTAILGIVVLGHWLSRRTGLPALLAVIVALGTLNATTLMIADVAQGKTPYGQITLLLSYLIPLVICPAWLLLAPSWRGKKYGVLLSWVTLLLGIGLVLPLLDVYMQPHAFRWMNPLILLGGLLGTAPLLIGLWLAFTLYEKQYLGLEDVPAELSGNGSMPPTLLNMVS